MLQRVLEPEVMDPWEEALDYDQMDHTGPNTAFVQRLVELGATGHMLDIGTGPGHIPLLIAERLPHARILAIDLSDSMLKIADLHRRASRHANQIRFEKADASNLPYPDNTFDCVFSNTIIHHIADPRQVLTEAHRVLRPGGAYLIRDLFRPDDIETVDHLVKLHAGDANPQQQKLFRDSLIAALTPDELRQLANDCGLHDLQLVIDTDRHMSLQRPAQHAAEP